MTECNVVYLLCHILRTYSIFKFVTLFFDRSETNKKLEIGSYLIYYIVTATAYCMINMPMITTFLNIIIFLLITFNYPSSIKKRLLVTLYTYTIMAILEFVAFWGMQYTPWTNNLSENVYTISMHVFLAMLTYVSVLIMSNFKIVTEDGEVSTVKWIATITIPIITVVIALLPAILQIDVEFKFLIFVIGAMFFINIIVFYLYDEMAKSAQQTLDNELITLQNLAYKKQLNVIYQSQENLSLFRHDMKNHFNTLKHFIRENNGIEALKYIDNAFEAIDAQFEYCKSGNYVIDSIINLKASQAKQLGIKLLLEVKVPPIINIEAFDLTAILGNLFDNALSGAKDSEDKKINFIISYEYEVLLIRVTNSFNGKVKKQGNAFISTKSGKNHGIGITSIKRAVDKYDGEIKFEYDAKTFIANVLVFDRIISLD